jgi:hypothetical protein
MAFSLRSTTALAMAALILCGAGGVQGNEPPAQMPPAKADLDAPSKATREQMAAVHEKMAACLRSDKSFADCRTEMQKNCQSMMSRDSCPMMGMGPGMRRHMMQPQ